MEEKMTGEIVLKGRAVVSSSVEGEAIVSKTPFSFFLGVNTDTGEIIEEGHECQGESIAGKVLVYPFGKGSSGDCLRLWRCANNGVAPIAILNQRPESVHVQGAIVANIPMVCDLYPDPIALIESGDWIRINGNEVTIHKKNRL
jgi:predicted aconitase with swiveling domain